MGLVARAEHVGLGRAVAVKLIRPERAFDDDARGYQIAVDNIGAGAGETVLLLDEGNGARQVLKAPGAPIRTVVIGIVDEVTSTVD